VLITRFASSISCLMCGFTVPTTLHKCLLHGTVPLGRAITLVPGTSVSLSTQLSYFLFLPDGCSATWLSTQTELASWYRNLKVDMTYFKTPWRNNLFQKFMDPSLDKFPTFYGNQRFITMFEIGHHWSLS